MKLFVIVDSYPPHHAGGYELRCKDVLLGLEKKGHNVEIVTTLCPAKNCNTHYSEQKIFRNLHKKSKSGSISTRIFNDFLDMCFIDRKIKDFQPDIVYLWHIGDLSDAIVPYFSTKTIPTVFDDGGRSATFLAKVLKRGLYFYRNENEISFKKWLKEVMNFAINKLSFDLIKTIWFWPQSMIIYFNSKHSAEYAQNHGVPIDGSKILLSGLEISMFQFKPRNKVDLPIKILAPGRISPEKGLKDAVLLVSKLKEKNIPATLTLIGKKYSSSYYLETISEIKKYGLEDDVRLLPMIKHNEIVDFYHESDFCFFSSYQKYGLSRIPLEAMASGCLVITYGNEGSDEIIRNRKTGLIVQEGNIDASVTVIQEILSDKTLYCEIIKNARRKIKNDHSMEIYIDRIEKLLYSALSSSKSKAV